MPFAVNASASAFRPPSLSFVAVGPILIVFGVAGASLLFEAFAPRHVRFRAQLLLTLLGLTAALVDIVVIHRTSTLTATFVDDMGGTTSALAVDSFALFIQATILVLAILATFLIAERGSDGSMSAIVAQAAVVVGSKMDARLRASGRVQTEIFPLLSFAVAGMLVFPAANDLLVLFIALEVFSLPLYLMVGMARRRRVLSQEAAIKYFLLGAFASALLLYGIALLYGYAGKVDLASILVAQNASTQSDILLDFGFGLLIVGLLFKAGVAPFHAWTPDVYQGAPTPVTAFMASCTKVAAFGAIARVLYVGFSVSAWDFRPVIWAVAISSMLVGAVFGLTQTNVKRLLAYSSITHAGFILVALVSLDTLGLESLMFYLVAYGLTAIAGFGLLAMVRDSSGEALELSSWAGLSKRSPTFSITFAFVLLAMAGVPLTSGFIAKFVVFKAAFHVAAPLVVIGLVTSAVAAFFYLRVVVVMFFADPPDDGPSVTIPSRFSSIAIALATAGTLFLGVFPQPLLDLTKSSANLRG